MKSLTTILIILALIIAPAFARIAMVPGEYPTIQSGINSCNDGDTVLVQPGTYNENINFNGHNIVVGSLFLLDGDPQNIELTVIDGSQSGPVVTIENNEDTTASLIGFAIINGSSISGSGIVCVNSSPKISHNYIHNNEHLSSNGGGVNCVNADPIIEFNRIYENVANNGGGIGMDNSAPLISNNNIFDNYSYRGYGGGIYCVRSSDARITNNRISTNEGFYSGGGIYCLLSDNSIKNNVINENYSGSVGGGVYCEESDVLLLNNTITLNIAWSRGDGIYSYHSAPIITNTIIWGNIYEQIHNVAGSLVVNYSNIEDGYPGDGNIDLSPAFRYPDYGDFHLMSVNCGDQVDSPCIDAGDPAIADYLLDCDRGLGAERSDMGAYGGGAIPTDIHDHGIESSLPAGISIRQNYPNPFNSATVISYSLSDASYITINVYNVLGELEATIFEGIQQPGRQNVTWDASGFRSGIYFARVQADNRSVNIRMVLVK